MCHNVAAVSASNPLSAHGCHQDASERGADSLSLELIRYGDSSIRDPAAIGHSDVTRHPDDRSVAPMHGGERLVRVMVDRGEIGELAGSQLRLGSEEPAVPRFRAEPREQGGEAGAIRGLQRADANA